MFLIGVTLLLASFSSSGALTVERKQDEPLEILSHTQAVFISETCGVGAPRSCGLMRSEFTVRDYRGELEGSEFLGTALYASYRTSSFETLDDYVFVQFMRGCAYFTREENGVIEFDFAFVSLNFDQMRELRYPEWVIESFDRDPVYNSAPNRSRHYHYRWNAIPGSFDEKTREIYGTSLPPFPELYVVDHPYQAYLEGDKAKNVSFEFLTCLYRTRDVPVHVSTNEIDFAVPISCFPWTSSFLYNHATRVFERTARMAEVCRGEKRQEATTVALP